MAGRALITGGAGFIGSHLVRALLSRGHKVRVMDNLATGSLQNLEAVQNDIEFLRLDLRDKSSCGVACKDVDVVFHLGALGSVPRSIEDPFTTNDVNVCGTLNLLAAARNEDVRRVVFSSSSSVYGDTPVLPKREDMRLSPRSPYAVSKACGEEYCRAFTLAYGLETVVLRYFNVFGPRQSPASQYAAVIPKFMSALLKGHAPVIHGDGCQSRDFTYVDNVVAANLLAGSTAGVAGEVFNIACGEQIAVGDVLGQIAELLHHPCEPIHIPARSGDVRHSRADIGYACDRLAYQPSVYFAHGLSKTVQAYAESFAEMDNWIEHRLAVTH
jgi:UDP-glucose 4-epimerase